VKRAGMESKGVFEGNLTLKKSNLATICAISSGEL